MAMRDLFRGDRDRDRERDRWRESWRDENKSGRQEDERHYSQGEDWGRDREREYGRFGGYGAGLENPQFYGQSGRSDWREGEYGRDYGDRFRSGEQRGYGGGRRYEGGFYTGESERGGQYGGGGYGGSQYGRGQYGGREYGSESGGEYGGASGSRFAGGRFGYGGAGSMSSQTDARVTESFRGRGPRGYQRSDERIREEVCEFLTDDPSIDASNVEVTVKSGEVTLSGTVNSRQEKRLAADIIEDLSGVKDVHNNLRVASEQSMGAQTTGTQSTQTQPPRH